MAREPKQKTIDNPRMLGGMDILYSNVIPYDIPRYTDGNLWRYVAGKQPVVQACITSMVMYAQSLPWDIRSIEAKNNKKYDKELKEYKRIFNESGDAGRLNHLDFLIQDYYSIPFGGASEAVRYGDGRLFKIVNIDGATLYPTNNPTMPVMQKVGVREPIFYKPDEINRMYQTPRTEISRAGWGMTPVEKVYLAVELLSRGDKYYAQLLLDTPEAGLLDLGDMSKESAEKWLESFKNLVSGIDAFKIPVLYQHTVPAKFIPFGRPPTELMFNDVTFKYAELICSAFGISVGDIGLKHVGGGSALSGQMRDERHAKATGYASLKAHIKEYYDKFLPDYLEFVWIDTDDELLVAKGRARSANGVGLRNLVEGGMMTPKEGRDQLVADGLITIPLVDEPNPDDFSILNDISGLNDQIDIQQQQVNLQKKQLQFQQTQPAPVPGKPTSGGGSKSGPSKSKGRYKGQGGQGLNKQRNLRGGKLENVQGKDNVPASQGGQGEIKSEYIEKEPLLDYIDTLYSPVKNGLSIIRSRRLIKSAIKKNYSMVQLASHQEDFESWKTNYLENLFNLVEDSDIKDIVSKQIEEFQGFVKTDNWYEIKLDKAKVSDLLAEYYADGLIEGAENIQNALYEDGRTNSLELKSEFDITNSDIKLQLINKAESLETFINTTSEYNMTRLALGVIVELASNHLEMIQKSSLDEILNNDEFIQETAERLSYVFPRIIGFSSAIESLVETAFLDGLNKQYEISGVTKTENDFDKTKLENVKTEYYTGN